MPILSILYTFILYPLELLFEVVFVIAERITGSAGPAIIILSLVINLLVLPLYKRADELQAEERDIQARMAPRLKHIKEISKGDERFFLIREYYRINHYKPVYALKSSISLLLQIPFFIAAYNLLSGMKSLQGMSFGFISDLGREDASFIIGNFPVNILPILMTLINIVSGIIYTKGHPLKAKIQVYGLAAVFMVLLYHSPSGLVFYWLLNNVFSLAKNIVIRIKNKLSSPHIKEVHAPVTAENAKSNVCFFAGIFMMALLTGFLIPSSVINSSPEEFINAVNAYDPVIYIANTLVLSFGCWILWGSVFYFLMSRKNKNVFSCVIWLICGISVVDYIFFGKNLGILSATLQYEKTPAFTRTDYLINTLAVILTGAVLYLVYSRHQKITRYILLAGVLTVLAISSCNSVNIFRTCSLYQASSSYSSGTAEINLSRNGKNVVVLMLDRAAGPLVPYLLEERPELKEKFDGFTYYRNTISYGPCTNFGSPALYGGYEYTPARINERSDEKLVDKQNEALKVMPAIFDQNGYKVTVCDPPLAGYRWIPDLSIYEDYPDIRCYITSGRFDYFKGSGTDTPGSSVRLSEIRNRNFFCFSILRISPVILQNILYDQGLYNEADSAEGNSALVQTRDGLYKSTGFDQSFLDSYPVLVNLCSITKANDSADNNFLLMANDTTHAPCLLQEPDYVPAMNVDNSAYQGKNTGSALMATEDQITHYHVNMAAFLRLGEWFDYLRENGVYDNTRIILVADHGRGLGLNSVSCNYTDMEFFMPLLMVKDFDSSGFMTSEEFMTNGDTPVLATSGLINDPVNPFTGNPVNSDLKEGPQTVFFSDEWNTFKNNGNTFLPGSWFELEGNPYNIANWTYLGDH